MKNKKLQIQTIVEVSVFSAVAVVLEVIFGMIYQMPWGGTISLAMLPIFIVAVRRGLVPGIIAGIVFGVIQSLIFPFVISALQYVMDYIVTFAVLGFAALVSGALTSAKKFAYAILIGSFFRLISATITGVIFWKTYIPGEMAQIDGAFHTGFATAFSNNAGLIIGSLIYNAIYLVPSAILCIIVGILLVKRQIIQYRLA